MNPEMKFTIKAFLWDQIVRPVYFFFNLNTIGLFSVAMTFSSMIIFDSVLLALAFFILSIVLYIYEIVKYYQSGEFKSNYRKFHYGDYKAKVKEIKRAGKKLPSPSVIAVENNSVEESSSELGTINEEENRDAEVRSMPETN